MRKLIKLLSSRPLFILLLPLFFVVHGIKEHAVLAPIREGFWVLLVYISCALVLYFIVWLRIKYSLRAGLFCFSLLAFQFFFGSVHDFSKEQLGTGFFTSYKFLLPFFLLLFLLLFIYLLRSQQNFTKTALYLNGLLLLFVLLDLGSILHAQLTQEKIHVAKVPLPTHACSSCNQPDVYLIIADEYAGEEELQQLFSFSNETFEKELVQRGFHLVRNSASNYNATLFSMASLLNMGYLEALPGDLVTNETNFQCLELIRNNQLTQFLEQQGYLIHNCSFFDIGAKKRLVTHPLFPSRRALFNAQTFTHRVQRDLGFHLASKETLARIQKRILYQNRTIDSALRSVAAQKSTAPKFVYAHFTYPHHPYYFDSAGTAVPDSCLTDANKVDKQAYISYLKYANHQLIGLIDRIREGAQTPFVIMLMGDHGFRQFAAPVDKRYYFMNLNAVFLPHGDYSGFYPGMTGVNQFRVLLNKEFGGKLPLLPDSSRFLYE